MTISAHARARHQGAGYRTLTSGPVPGFEPRGSRSRQAPRGRLPSASHPVGTLQTRRRGQDQGADCERVDGSARAQGFPRQRRVLAACGAARGLLRDLPRRRAGGREDPWGCQGELLDVERLLLLDVRADCGGRSCSRPSRHTWAGTGDLRPAAGLPIVVDVARPLIATVPVALRVLDINWGGPALSVVLLVLASGLMVGYVEELLFRGIAVRCCARAADVSSRWPSLLLAVRPLAQRQRPARPGAPDGRHDRALRSHSAHSCT